MFKYNANTVFNNKEQICRMISPMHPQMARLYSAALLLHGKEGPSNVAKLIHSTPQTVKNWEERGISNEGLLAAQEFIGCNAIWLRDGTGEMLSEEGDAALDQVIELIALFQQSSSSDRENILLLARKTAQRNAARWIRTGDN